MSAIPPVCNFCNKSFRSMTTYYVHKREKHEYNTCIQRGGKALRFYYIEDEIILMKTLLECKTRINENQDEIKNVILSLGIEV